MGPEREIGIENLELPRALSRGGEKGATVLQGLWLLIEIEFCYKGATRMQQGATDQRSEVGGQP